MAATPEKARVDTDVLKLMADLEAGARARGRVSRQQLYAIARVKSPRRADLCLKNSDATVEGVTSLAFNEIDEGLRMNLLRALHGVDIPVGSCILAWVHPERWPVIDRFAWRCLHRRKFVNGCKKGVGLGTAQWLQYLKVVMGLSADTGWSPQRVDTWLWRDGGRG